MHDDKRNYYYRTSNNSAPRASGAPQNNARPTQNTGTHSTRPVGNGTTQNINRVQNGAQGTAPRNNTGMNTGNMQQVRTATGARAPQAVRTPNGVQIAKSQPVRNISAQRKAPAESAFARTKKWIKKTYAVDKKAVAEREAVRLSLIREKGSIDYVFFILVLLLLAFGTVMVYSASYAFAKTEYGDSYHIIFRQILFIIVGFAGMAVAAMIPPQFYKKVSPFVFIGCFALLCIVPIPIPGFTVVHNGARRWINLGFTEIQPSEFMKLGLAMMLAWYFDRFYERVTPPTDKIKRYLYGVITPLAITGAVCVLVLIEKHLSGTIIMAAIGAILVFASGAPSFWMLPGIAGAGGILALLIAILPHARKRFEIWRNPWLDPTDGGYQTLQGLYAIGSGGLFGVGLGNSYQKHMYVSMPHNDFIFVIVCEELGFIGAVAVIALFALLVWRGMVIAMNAPDVYSQLLTMGIIGKIALQALLNIAVVTNTIPNTGISLPFFSYGGSSLVVLMVEMGIVLSISRYSKQKK